mmetsp:Transcript_55043/g.120713  ORF Transcript_55043/g.120713 Transcript_55043/m.120713 type:complete len:133 (-) Transcript_55043:157-555(-)
MGTPGASMGCPAVALEPESAWPSDLPRWALGLRERLLLVDFLPRRLLFFRSTLVDESEEEDRFFLAAFLADFLLDDLSRFLERDRETLRFFLLLLALCFLRFLLEDELRELLVDEESDLAFLPAPAEAKHFS